MNHLLNFTRRAALPAVALATSAASAAARAPAPAGAFGLDANSSLDQSARLQAAIDQTTLRGVALQLPLGKLVVGDVKLRPGSRIVGATGAGSVLSLSGAGPILTARDANGLVLEGFALDGAALPMDAKRATGLLVLDSCRDISLTGVAVRNSSLNGIALRGVSGRVYGCILSGIKHAAMFSLDGAGLDVSHNTISDCADNGILIWRTRHGEDGTTLSANRISRITNASGGTGQYGNGINIYRAARVMVANNIISDCAYTAIRANESSNAQMVANSIMRIGEVALYAEAADERVGAAGFEGCVMSSNIIDDAAAGLVVTNFNNGGRLAIVQGNLIRNLKRREHEKVDKRGEGIAVEADAIVSNNVIENAPTCGIMIGWGRHMRDCLVTGNLIRKSRIGIAVTSEGGAGQCVVSHNMITDALEGAIRTMDHAKPVGADLLSGKAPRHIVLNGNTAG